ncbi:hypothetical protein [Sphingomonas mucosissima]|uniref:hypothetical protein n=1 Tax=Sphingomonas mucosissima TaxID=370959 RepID=UPI001124CF6B|nr:hypothetical protein [Sphingomonas mucosissima]
MAAKIGQGRGVEDLSVKRVLYAGLCSSMVAGQFVAASLALAYGNPVPIPELTSAVMLVLVYGGLFGAMLGVLPALAAAALLRMAGARWSAMRGPGPWVVTGTLVGATVGAVLFGLDGKSWGVASAAAAGGVSSLLFRFWAPLW